MAFLSGLLIFVLVLLLALSLKSFGINQEYQRGVLFRLEPSRGDPAIGLDLAADGYGRGLQKRLEARQGGGNEIDRARAAFGLQRGVGAHGDRPPFCCGAA